MKLATSTVSTTSLSILNGGATASLAKVGGGAFDLSSIDLAGNNSNTSSAPVTFTGQKADNSTVSQIFTTSVVPLTLNTFNFNNFTNLVSVSWAQVSPFHQFDNINVSAAGSTSVPEPFTILGTIFGAGYGVALKRKLTNKTSRRSHRVILCMVRVPIKRRNAGGFPARAIATRQGTPYRFW